MKTPRNLSARDLISRLATFGYEVTRQKGSHIRLTRVGENKTHHITVPNHDPLKLGTLASILTAVSENLQISKEDILH